MIEGGAAKVKVPSERRRVKCALKLSWKLLQCRGKFMNLVICEGWGC